MPRPIHYQGPPQLPLLAIALGALLLVGASEWTGHELTDKPPTTAQPVTAR